MNKEIINEISKELDIKDKYVEAVLKLLEEGNTIPFIARYRKELTNSMDEDNIKKITEVYNYEVNLLKRKEEVIRLIDEKGLLTNELVKDINEAKKLVDVEDIYRPFKEKKKTLATIAIKKGLEPLAKLIMKCSDTNIKEEAKKYLNKEVSSVDDAILGASHIISEIISDDAKIRKWIRNYTYKNSNIISTKKKDSIDEKQLYENYYDFSEKISYIKPHRILAINRGEKEGILTVSIDFNEEVIFEYTNKKYIKEYNESGLIIKEAIIDGFKRLIKPSIQREIRNDLTDKANQTAIKTFGINLERLLLTPPLKEKVVLGFDPAFRTGCKLAVVSKTGSLLEVGVIYPHEPVNKKEEAKKALLDLIDKYNIDVIAIGNGTASRESELFVSEVIKDSKRKVEYIIVNEAGASVYSASEIAKEEFPELTVEKRSAISIGRRLQDPLSELVKITPESIGVGLYQHDVNNKDLRESLDFVVSKTVNSVGVNINTASKSILNYISGLNKSNIDKLIKFRENKGKIESRNDILKHKLLTPKAYEQAIGFLRVLGNNKLDETSIHPESYDKAKSILKELKLDEKDIGTDKLKEVIDSSDLESIRVKLNIDTYTFEDIIKAFKSPSLDPRDSHPKPLLRSDVLTIDDLKEGMKLEGTVRNVLPFGAFVDIGLDNDGLIHISELSTNYVKDPMDVVMVGDIINCYVLKIDKDKEKVSLTMIEKNI